MQTSQESQVYRLIIEQIANRHIKVNKDLMKC